MEKDRKYLIIGLVFLAIGITLQEINFFDSTNINGEAVIATLSVIGIIFLFKCFFAYRKKTKK